MAKKGPKPKIPDEELIHYHVELGMPCSEMSQKLSNKPFDTNFQARLKKLGVYHRDKKWLRGRDDSIPNLKDGYYRIKKPNHPRADPLTGYVFYHLYVKELQIGRHIFPPERVHHKDCNSENNNKENLLLCKDNSDHFGLHAQVDKIFYNLVKIGIVDFDKIKGVYFLNYDNPKPMPKKHINPESSKHSPEGYRVIKCPDNPRANLGRGRVFEHIVVLEDYYYQSVHIGPKYRIPEKHPIHHINGDKDDNNVENLWEAPSKWYHNKAIRKQKQNIITELMDDGVIIFDDELRKYRLF